MQWQYLTGTLDVNGWFIPDGGNPATQRTPTQVVALNELGRNGWELVSAWYDAHNDQTRAVLKRPLSS